MRWKHFLISFKDLLQIGLWSTQCLLPSYYYSNPEALKGVVKVFNQLGKTSNTLLSYLWPYDFLYCFVENLNLSIT